jgi:glycosyltransferase involved in cell wall biosynthesis
MDLSVVIPCLNESETLAICIEKAKKQINKLKLNAEIIISDNGSTDGSQEIAINLGATVSSCNIKGYGSAVINGIKNSKGKFILIADGDDSYNFNDLPKFYEKINQGYDLVQGCRMPAGGGKIEKGAMPLSHRIIGNPFFSKLVKLFYNVQFNDVYCGMKIIRNDFFKNSNFFSEGMVFCLEILIKSKIMEAKVSEVPITLHKDGRINSKSHLKTIKDGLKTLKFILISSPKWIFFFPSILSFFICSSFFLFILNSTNYNFTNIKIITLMLFFYTSFQFFMLGLFSSLRAKKLGLGKGLWLDKFFRLFSLRLSLIISFIIIVIPFFYLIMDYNFFSTDIVFLLLGFNIFFGVSLAGNSLTVSLLSLNK